MVYGGIELINGTGLVGFLSYPTSIFYQFYAVLFGALFITLALILWNNDRDKEIKPDFISCLGISAIAIIILAGIGKIAGFVENGILLELLAMGSIFIAIWLFKK